MPLNPRIILRKSVRALAFALLAFGTLTCQVQNAENRSVLPSTATLTTWPNTLEGRVLEVDGGTLFIASGNERVRLTTSAATVVWDGLAWVADVPTRVDDFVFAQGIWKRDHSFDARQLYVNIVNLRGKASAVNHQDQGATFHLADQYQQTDTIAIMLLTEIYEDTGAKFAYEQKHVLPSNGSYVEVIGRQMADGTIMAVHITLSASVKGQAQPPISPSVTMMADPEQDAKQQVIAIALTAARGWGEPNPQVTNVRHEGRENFTQELQARGEQVPLAGSGDLWVVELSGAFTPDRMPPGGGALKCAAMYVAIDANSYEVISAGCE